MGKSRLSNRTEVGQGAVHAGGAGRRSHVRPLRSVTTPSGESGIDLTVVMRGATFVDQFLIKHEFIKRLHDRFAGEGIVIPYPIRALNYDQEKKG